jgi:NAD kinase
MDNNRILQQIYAIFGIFMVMFYIGGGIFFLFFADRYFNLNKALFGIMGGSFLLYGIYRIFVSYKQLVDAFFTKNEDEE